MPLLIPHWDSNFSTKLAPSCKHFNCKFLVKKFTNLPQLLAYCKLNKVTKVAISCKDNPICPHVFGYLEGAEDDNWGTYAKIGNIEFMLIPYLKIVYDYSYGEFLLDHYMQKLAYPNRFLTKDVFNWEYLDFQNYDSALQVAAKSFLCAIDIETRGEDDEAIITSCSYTFLFQTETKIKSKTFVINVQLQTLDENFYIMKHLNLLPIPKVFQNGQYDNAFFLRFGVPVKNWAFDTMTLAHAIYCELPKALHFASSLYILNYTYWKDDNKKNLYEYNGKDTHNTAWLLLAMLDYIRRNNLQYAIKNFLIKFPMNFPFLQGAMTGVLIDAKVRDELKAKEEAKATKLLKEVCYLLDWPTFNPKSPQQTLALMNGLGFYGGKTFKSSDKASMNEFAESHPLWEYIKTKIVAYRKATKAISTYFETPLFHDRLMWQQNPSGTETGRTASKASFFWCGTQIQNMPPYAKPMVVCEEGWLFAEIDKSQAESRCTAYLSQDLNLIETVETSPDFHCTNASLFFGIPFDDLYRVAHYDEAGNFYPAQVLQPDIRKIAKPINHGFNYNMGEFMLITIMGVKAILHAAKVLKLPRAMSIPQIAGYLLDCVNRAYPSIKGSWYKEVIYEVLTTGKLTGVTGFTRRTFLKPNKSKSHLNKVVAHHPQSLSALKVDIALLKWWKSEVVSKPKPNIKFLAQIHDSIFVRYRIGHEAEVHKLAEIMENTTVVIHGRTLKIPVDVKLGGKTWGELKT